MMTEIKSAPTEAFKPAVVPVAANDNRPFRDYIPHSADSLTHLTRPGGVVEDMVDWIVSSSSQPSRELALAATIPFLASLMGRRFATGERDTRANIYVVALAESGFGKEHARSQINRLQVAAAGNFDKFGGPARIMSASALRSVLESTPSVNCQIDEFGSFVRGITEKTASTHARAISADLRDYYSASSTFFAGAAYAGSKAVKIHNPNLCIYGTSTPEQFWDALSSASAEDGLLPRLLLFDVCGPRPEKVKPSSKVTVVPSELLRRLEAIAGTNVPVTTVGEAQAKVGQSPARTSAVPWDDDASVHFEALVELVDAEESMVAPEARPFLRRVLENATKLALIAAVGANQKKPVVTGDNMDWAVRLSWCCATTMVEQVAARMADSAREAAVKKIMGLVRQAGKSGIALGRIADRTRSIDTRLRTEVVKDLEEAGHLVEEKFDTGGRPRTRLRWVE